MLLEEIIGQPKMYIAIGPSGAGKSTYFNQLKKQVPNIEYYSWDALRHEFYDKNDYQRAWELSIKDPKWNQRQRDRFFEIVKQKNNVYIDNTNVTKKARRFFIETGKRFGYYIIGIVFETPLKTVIDRQQTRTDKSVPEDAVTKQWNLLQANLPKKEEGFDEIIYVNEQS